MEDPQTILTVSSCVLLIAAVVLMNIQVFGLSLKSIYFGDNMKFEKSRAPRYIMTLVGVLLLSLVYGFIVSSDLSLALQFAAFNLVIVAIGGINLLLHRRHNTKMPK